MFSLEEDSPDRKWTAAFVSVFVYYVYDLDDHVLLAACLINQISLGLVLVDALVAPHFQLAILANVKHVFEDLEEPKLFVEQLEPFQGSQVAVKTVLEGDVFDTRQVGEDSFIEYTQIRLVNALLKAIIANVQRGHQIQMLVSYFEFCQS